MSSTPIGCFSWLCGGKPKDSRGSTKVDQKGKAPQVVPTTGDYAFEASKQTIEILRKFGDALPIPCANQVLEIGLLLLTTYEDVTAIEEQVKELNNRISALMLIMVDQLNGKDAKNISPEIVKDIERLGTDLQAIRQNLDQIAAQNRLLLIFFKNANKTAIDGCLDRLKDSLQTFQVARAIQDGNMLFEIQGRLKEIDKTTKKIAEQVHELYGWLKPKSGHNAQDPVLEEMPTIPPLHGRDGVIQDIIDYITVDASPRVGIIGAGGMGKTSVAIAVMRSDTVALKYDAEHRFWVPCIGVTSILSFIRILIKSLRVTKDTGNPLKDLLDTLTSSKEPRLLLLDNMETAMNLSEVVTENGRLSVEAVLNQLANIPHVGLLVTIRSNQLPSQHVNWRLFPLQGVAQDEARAIFIDIYPKAKEDPSLNSLLEVLGYMPYAVTLMANQAVVLEDVDLKDLLDEWKKNGPNALTDDLKLKMNRSIELSIKSRPMENANAQQLLAILSKLPSGTSQQNLKWWASSVQSPLAAIATLKKTALVTSHQEGTTSTLFVFPVVQSYLREDPFYNSVKFQGLVLEACCKFVLNHKSSPGDQNFKAHLDALAFEQVNIQAILLSVTEERFAGFNVASSTVLEAMVTFSWFQYWTKSSVELLKHMLSIATSTLFTKEETTALHVAEAHYCLGTMYWRISRYSDSDQELQIAHAQFQKLDNLIRAGDSKLALSKTHQIMGKPSSDRLKLIREAQKELKHDPAGSARALVALGDYYRSIGEPGKGLEVLKTARASLEEHGCAKDVAECMGRMSRCYAKLGDLDDCLETCERGLEAAKRIGSDAHVVPFLHISAMCQIRLANYDQVLGPLREALAISEVLGDPELVGQILELIGYALAMKREYKGSRIAYDRAKQEYSSAEVTPQTIRELTRCNDNLRRLDQANVEEGVVLNPPNLYQ